MMPNITFYDDIRISLHENAVAIIFQSMKKLLEKKHLYQNILIDFDDIKKKISEVVGKKFPNASQEVCDMREQQPLTDILNNIENRNWRFDYNTQLSSYSVASENLNDPTEFLQSYIELNLPDINVVCKNCKGEPLPHNPGYKEQKEFLNSANFGSISSKKKPTLNSIALNIFSQAYKSSNVIQTFFFPYQCQKCKGEPLIFMVRRQGLKLHLVGRNHFEEVDVPIFLPTEERHYPNVA